MSNYYLSLYLRVSYMLISITKRAQYPFSMWLPLAIDAPTPVSALVHRRTLVTAGLFLMARIMPESYNTYLLLIGGTTLCVGGYCAIFSSDLKKLIANSTLSNLGLIAFILALSDKSLIVFHLYTHALFKAGLFIAAGAILIRRFGAQDRRSLYGGGKGIPLLGSMVSCFVVSSIGLFFLSTFFSKHQISLICQILPVNILSLIMIRLGIIFTRVYSMRFCYVILRRSTKIRLSSRAPSSVLFPIGILGFASIWYGNFAGHCLLSSTFCYEAPTNMLALIGVFTWILWGNNLSSNLAKRIMYIDSLIDALSRVSRAIKSLKDLEFSIESIKNSVVTFVRKAAHKIKMVASKHEVGLGFPFISLCLIASFF